MKIETVEVDGRRGRIFLRSTSESYDHARLRDGYADAEDLARAPLLAEALSGTALKVTADPLVEMHDVFALYVQPNGENDPALFACTIVSQHRLQQILEEEPVVFENFTFQVAECETLTDEEIKRAFVGWAERNFAGAVPARIDLQVLPAFTSSVDLLLDEEVADPGDTSKLLLQETFTSFGIVTPAWKAAA